MEELTIEQKAKRFDEAIKIVKSKIKDNKDHVLYEEDIIEIFPELKKKTDEEMIQKLISVVHLYYGEGVDAERDECLKWLEKQSKNKPIERKEFTSIPFGAFDSELYESMITIPDGCVATIENNKIHIKRKGKSATEAIKEEKVNNSNKVEPKFHEGDYIVDINCGKVLRISEILTEGYLFENGGYSTFNNTNKRYRLWNIKDAKDGDVICYKDEISLYKHAIINCTKGITFGGFVYHCCYDGKRFITDSLYSLAEQDKMDIHPATTEQCNILFQKMKEEGYGWDNDNKELKKLEQKPIAKVEQRLHVGDYVVRKDGKKFHDDKMFAKITKIDGILCQFDCGTWLYNDEIKLWTLTDAQDGDILTSSDSKAFIYNGNFNEYLVGAYCGLDIYDEFVIADNECDWCSNYNIKPATEKQRQALFNEMNLLNYIWNPETKELNRLDKK